MMAVARLAPGCHAALVDMGGTRLSHPVVALRWAGPIARPGSLETNAGGGCSRVVHSPLPHRFRRHTSFYGLSCFSTSLLSTVNSTRRFCAMFSGLVFGTRGRDSP